jgi:hypothetical protein
MCNTSMQVHSSGVSSVARHGALRFFAFALACLALACTTATTDVSAPGVAESSAGASDGSAGNGHDVGPRTTWCDVAPLLAAKCQRCHGAPPENGAPFSLATYEDTQRVSKAGKARFTAIEAAIANDYMPPSFIALDPPVERLSDSEKEILLDWCHAGAPGPADECDAP